MTGIRVELLTIHKFTKSFSHNCFSAITGLEASAVRAQSLIVKDLYHLAKEAPTPPPPLASEEFGCLLNLFLIVGKYIFILYFINKIYYNS